MASQGSEGPAWRATACRVMVCTGPAAEVRPVRVCHGVARCAESRRRRRRWVGPGRLRRAEAAMERPGPAGFVAAGGGKVAVAHLGWVSPDPVRPGLARQRRKGGASAGEVGSAPAVKASRGWARQANPRRGEPECPRDKGRWRNDPACQGKAGYAVAALARLVWARRVAPGTGLAAMAPLGKVSAGPSWPGSPGQTRYGKVCRRRTGGVTRRKDGRVEAVKAGTGWARSGTDNDPDAPGIRGGGGTLGPCCGSAVTQRRDRSRWDLAWRAMAAAAW